YIDECFKRHADELTERGVRFGVFFYSWADSERKARDEAWEFVRYARAYDPLFWAVDVERPEITREAILAFAEELRGLVGDVEKIGAYVANHLYADYGFDAVRDRFDFVWIPRYGQTPPAHPCDLWQYTSDGSVAGIDRGVDLNRITGEGHGLAWFTEG
ncbi:MAG: N-acetylmuramoyl-L-alanine amidase, partial [Clostridia bacterium]|nr:N-acetylmuramoyl-L-alanine amidase [Clostridia bacterium]